MSEKSDVIGDFGRRGVDVDGVVKTVYSAGRGLLWW